MTDVRAATSGRVNFHARVAANVLRTVERELLDDSATEVAEALVGAGFPDEAQLAAAIRSGELDDRPDQVAGVPARPGAPPVSRRASRVRRAVRNVCMPTVQAEDIEDVADRLFTAIERSDTAAVRQLWDADIAVWKVGERRDRDKGRALRVIEWFVAATTDRHYEVLDRQLFDGGFVQQHILHGDGRNGTSISLRVCLVIKVGPNGLINRIDEYFDPAELAPLLD